MYPFIIGRNIDGVRYRVLPCERCRLCPLRRWVKLVGKPASRFFKCKNACLLDAKLRSQSKISLRSLQGLPSNSYSLATIHGGYYLSKKQEYSRSCAASVSSPR